MAQILIAIIQVNLLPSPSEAGRRQHKLTWIIAIKKDTSWDEATLISEEIKSLAQTVLELCLSEGISKY